mmetsp:Transcript_13346/g.34272  ORF Transcript_13346/g.34272 Transcript_13346/m.34272 type:complete len:158 (-) Transcript_13346:62-535(-)|eukprot:jgi/Tetstr1/466192/TSEL_010751.t1
MSVKVAGVELSDAEVAEFREVFDLVDKDRGGTIQADEVLELMQMLGMKPSKADVERMISEIDEDGNGEVDFSEFLQVMAGPQNLPYDKRELMVAFKALANPQNPAGTIHPKQLEEALTRYCGDTMKPEDIKRLVHAIEPRDDGLINYEEKINMFVSK